MLLDNPFMSDERVRKEAISCIKRGMILTLLCTKHHDLPSEETKYGIRVLRWLDPDLERPSYAFSHSLLNEISRLDFDLIYCHDMYLAGICIRIAQNNKNSCLVYDMHEYFVELNYANELDGLLNRFKGHLVYQYFRWHENRLIRRADLIIVPSEFIRQRLQHSFPLANLKVVRNIPDWKPEKLSDEQIQEVRSKLEIPAKAQVLIHSGNIYFSLDKLSLFINAYLDMDEENYLVIINDRPIANQIKQGQADNNTWRSRLRIIPFNQYPQKEILMASDIGWIHIESKLESRVITSPNRLYEYTLAGLPIVSTPQKEVQLLNQIYNHVCFYDKDSLDDFTTALEQSKYQSYSLPTQKPDISEINWEEEYTAVVQELQQIVIKNNSK